MVDEFLVFLFYVAISELLSRDYARDLLSSSVILLLLLNVSLCDDISVFTDSLELLSASSYSSSIMSVS